VPDDVPNPSGGEYARDAEGRLTGVMKNNVAFTPVASKNPAMASLDPITGLVTLLGK
jgi:hypothetical protein